MICVVHLSSRSKLSANRQSILSRARRRACPQIPKLLTAADIMAKNSAASTLLDRRLDTGNSAGGSKSSIMLNKNASHYSTGSGKIGASNSAAVAASKPKATVSRALQLVNKSKIVTAQQKVRVS